MAQYSRSYCRVSHTYCYQSHLHLTVMVCSRPNVVVVVSVPLGSVAEGSPYLALVACLPYYAIALIVVVPFETLDV